MPITDWKTDGKLMAKLSSIWTCCLNYLLIQVIMNVISCVWYGLMSLISLMANLSTLISIILVLKLIPKRIYKCSEYMLIFGIMATLFFFAFMITEKTDVPVIFTIIVAVYTGIPAFTFTRAFRLRKLVERLNGDLA